MAPTPPRQSDHSLPHDLYLIITFPTLACVYSATDYLRAIAAAAHESDNLLVLIKIANGQAFATSPHTTSLDSSCAPGGSLTSTSSSSPSSARCSAVHQPESTTGSSRLPTPTSHFHRLQHFLSRAYSTASQAFLADNRPLAKVEVVIDDLRRLPFCIPNGAAVKRIQVNQTETRNGKGKGKGKEHAIEQDGDGDEDEEPRRAGDEGHSGECYPVAALGGTFDHLHAGHRILLTLAAYITQDDGRIVVGVSDDNLLKNKKHPRHLEPLAHRIAAVRAFLELVRPTLVHDVVPLHDVYGPTATDPAIGALVVSDETVAGGEAINALRRGKGLGELAVWVIGLVAEDGGVEGEVGVGAKMGSTAIRAWLAGREEEGTGQV